jgi:hypothetical protein
VSTPPRSPRDVELLQAAVFAHQAMPIHAHAQPPQTMDHLFVSYGNLLTQIDSSEWQLIEGVRGAGKTHLMRVYQERAMRGAISNDGEVRSLPVYIDAQAFASARYSDDDERRAHASFRDFLETLGEQLLLGVGALDSRKRIYSWLRHPTRKDTAKQALTIVRELIHELDCKRFAYPWVEQLDRESLTETAHGHSGSSRQIGMSIAPSGPQASAGVHKDESLSTKQTREHTREGVAHSEPRWRRMGEKISEICTILEIERLTILIDNWTALDTYGNSLVQPYFAQLLKQSVGGLHTISVKIAAEGLCTRLWDPQRGLGLQRPYDVTPLVNLNKPLLDDEALISFFEELLFRRLLSCEGDLEHYVNPDQPGLALSTRFIEHLFGDRATFELLVTGSEGRMGLFLESVRELAHASDFSLAEPWSRSQVLRTIEELAGRDSEDYQYVSPAVRLLQLRVKPAAVERNERVFSVDRRTYDRHVDAMHELLSKGIISDQLPEPYHRENTANLRGFRVSEESWAEWHRARTFVQEVEELLGERRREVNDPPTLRDVMIRCDDD